MQKCVAFFVWVQEEVGRMKPEVPLKCRVEYVGPVA